MKYHVVCYSGVFAFMKPPGALRDKFSKSETFLSPSTQEGIAKKLEVSGILRHRLRCFDVQKLNEMAKAPNYKKPKKDSTPDKGKNVQEIGALIYPKLFLAFPTNEEAIKASENHIFLSRQEFILTPERIDGKLVTNMTQMEFDALYGWEFISTGNPSDMFVGIHRYSGEKSFGIVVVHGDPLGHIPIQPQRII
jgi:hypothetical protein